MKDDLQYAEAVRRLRIQQCTVEDNYSIVASCYQNATQMALMWFGSHYNAYAIINMNSLHESINV